MEFMHAKTVLSLLPHVFVGCRLSIAACVFLLLRWLIVFRSFLPCKVLQNEAFFRDSDLTEGHGGTKPRKSLEFDSEDGGAAGTVDSASCFGGEKVVETAKEIMRRKLLEKQEKQKKKKAEMLYHCFLQAAEISGA